MVNPFPPIASRGGTHVFPVGRRLHAGQEVLVRGLEIRLATTPFTVLGMCFDLLSFCVYFWFCSCLAGGEAAENHIVLLIHVAPQQATQGITPNECLWVCNMSSPKARCKR